MDAATEQYLERLRISNPNLGISSGWAQGESSEIDPAALSSTVGRALGGMTDNFGRSAQVVGRLTESPELQQWGEGVSQVGMEHGQRFGNAPTPFYSDVESMGEAKDWLQETVGGGLASYAPVVASAAVPALFRMGKTALAAASISGFGLNLGDVDQAMQSAAPNENNDWESVGIAAAMSAFDMLGASVILGPLLKSQGKEAVTKKLLEQGVDPLRVEKLVEKADLDSYVVHSIKSGASQGAIEVGQEALKLGAVAQTTDTELPEKTPEFLVNSLVGGMGAGTIAGAGATALEGGAAAVAERATPIRDKAVEKIQSSKLMAFMGVGSVQKLKPYAKYSPSLQKIVDMMVPDQSGKRATGPTVVEQKNINVGRHMAALEQAGLMTMPEEQVKAEFDAYSEGKRETPAQQAIANIFQDYEARGVKEGLLEKGLENYLSTHTDIEFVEANRDKFLQDIAPYYTDKDGSLYDKDGKLYAERMLDGYKARLESEKDTPNTLPRVDRRYLEENELGDTIVKERFQKNEDPEQLKHKVGTGKRLPEAKQLEGTRYWKKVPQHILNKYAKEQTGKDLLQSVRDYAEATEHRLGVAENFGAQTEKVNYLLASASKELAAQGMRLPKHIALRVYDIIDAHNGVLNLPSDPTLRSAVGNVTSAVNIIKLPLAGVSSVIEVMLPAIQADLGTMLKGVFPMIHQNVANMLNGITKTMPKSEAAKLAAELNITYQAAINTMAERTNDAMLTTGMATASKYFYQATGQTPLLHGLRVGSVVQGQEIVKRNLLAIASGINPQSQKYKQYTNQLRTLGINIESRQQAMELYSPQGDAQRAFADEKMRNAVRRFVDMSHFHPDAFNTSLWLNDGNFKAFAGLKKYASALTNNLMPQMARQFNSNYTGAAWYQGQYASLAATLTGMMIFGSALDWAKRILRGKGGQVDTRTLEQKGMDVASLAFLPLVVTFPVDIFDSVRYGRAPSGVMVGPAIGMLDDLKINQTIHGLMENPTDGEIWKRVGFTLTPVGAFKGWFEE